MKILPKFFSDTLLGQFVLGIILAVIFYYVILVNVLATSTPVVAVVSGSMEHTSTLEITHYEWLQKNLGYNKTYIDSWPVHDGLAIGDMPVVKGETNYNIGEVIVYSQIGVDAPIIHRVVKINPDGTFQTKGDNNGGQNPYESSVDKSQIKGKVIFIIPKVGYFKVLPRDLCIRLNVKIPLVC